MYFTYFIKFFPGFHDKGPDIGCPAGKHDIAYTGDEGFTEEMRALSMLF
jgi:hypothetical protein